MDTIPNVLSLGTFFRYVDELDHVAMAESGSSDSDNTITQGSAYVYCRCRTVTEEWFTETVNITAIQRAYFIGAAIKG